METEYKGLNRTLSGRPYTSHKYFIFGKGLGPSLANKQAY